MNTPKRIYVTETEKGVQYFTDAVPAERPYKTFINIGEVIDWLDKNGLKYVQYTQGLNWLIKDMQRDLGIN